MVRLSVEDYLEREKSALGKSECINGEVFAMADGAPRHSLLRNAAGSDLRAALRGSGCSVYSPAPGVLLEVHELGLHIHRDLASAPRLPALSLEISLAELNCGIFDLPL